MDWLTAFVEENWVLLLLAFFLILLLIRLVKTIMRWIITFIIVAGLLIYGASYSPTGKLDSFAAVQEVLTPDIANEYAKSLLNATSLDISRTGGSNFTLTAKVLSEGKVFTIKGSLSSGNSTLYVGNKEIPVKLDSSTLKFLQTKLNGQ